VTDGCVTCHIEERVCVCYYCELEAADFAEA
jgi:hypothetical protein